MFYRVNRHIVKYMFLLDNLLETHAKMLENMQISAQVRENLQHPVVDVQEVLIHMLRFDQ